jgi:hypothetical protein
MEEERTHQRCDAVISRIRLGVPALLDILVIV